MDERNIEGVIVNQLQVINVAGGAIKHAVKVSDEGFVGFGEAYFSYIESKAIKGWKRHHKMTLNLIVPEGKIKFVLYDSRESSCTYGKYQSIELSSDRYCRLTVPPMIWMAFSGMAKTTSMLLNVADIVHDPDESDRKNINELDYNWNDMT